MCKKQENVQSTPFYKTRTFLYGMGLLLGVAAGYMVATKKLSLGSVMGSITGSTTPEK